MDLEDENQDESTHAVAMDLDSEALEEDSAGAGIPVEVPKTAFDHFDDRTLFELDEDDEHYNFFCRQSNKKKLQGITLEAFFRHVEEQSQSRNMTPSQFFGFYGLLGKALIKAETEYNERKKPTDEIQRMVNVDYEISSQPLSHTYDLERLKTAIEDVFNWYDDAKKKPSKKEPSKQKVGPYLCFVQSSGMGKTKLMYEYRQDSFTEESAVASCLILPSKTPTSNPDIFDFQKDFRDAISNCKEVDKATKVIYATLDHYVTKTLEKNLENRKANQAKKSGNETLSAETLETMENRDKIVLMFDESQTLLKHDLKYDAFLFRCVRVWLREKRGNQKVVAVFAGTNSKITNFLLESDIQFEPVAESSRGLRAEAKFYFNKGSSHLYPPFYHTATMGSCRRDPVTGPTEYGRATNYGRPLFAILAKEGTLHQKISTVLRRMLIVPKERIDWDNELMAAINFLGTRVQMDDTSFAVISNLVAMAYANLSGCSEDCTTGKLAYLPDPVCARLAMCMMDEDFTHEPSPEWKEKIKGDKKTVKGKEKTWWTGKIRDIFSTGLVRPAKGDFGEVVVALYMLFCGDLLRKKISDAAKSKNKDSLEYNHFSVCLDAWLDLLLSGGRTPVDTKVPDSESRESPSVSVGFIQVCRNSIRSYKNSWASLGDQCFLRHIYESGVGFYVFEGCDLIDMVVPLRINRKDAKDEFIPMVISIKSEWTFPQAHAEVACEAMKQRATDSELTKVLCLLIVFGSKPRSYRFKGDISITSPATFQDGSTSAVTGKRRLVSQQVASTSLATHKSPRGSEQHAITFPDTNQKAVSQQDTSTSPDTDEILPVSKLLEKYGIVAKAIRVPNNDVFGLTDAFRDMTPDSQVNSELFSSHSFLMAHREGTHAELQAEDALRASSGETCKEKYDDLFDAMKTPATTQKRAEDEKSGLS